MEKVGGASGKKSHGAYKRGRCMIIRTERD